MDGEVFETKRCGKVDSRERDVILRSAVDGAVGERNNGTVLEELALAGGVSRRNVAWEVRLTPSSRGGSTGVDLAGL